jgi:hypothetical protein
MLLLGEYMGFGYYMETIKGSKVWLVVIKMELNEVGFFVTDIMLYGKFI